MKTQPKLFQLPARPRASGFSLIVTITLMILLSLLAVGIMTLSTTVLRGNENTEAIEEARSNARLALSLAIGDLQSKLGSDRAISAPANIRDSSAPFGLTGAWESWERSELISPDYDSKDGKFLGWLTSDSLLNQNPNSQNPPAYDPSNSGVVKLLGNGSLGGNSGASGIDQEFGATLVETNDGNKEGGFAWAVIDESTKARLNLREGERDMVGSDLYAAQAGSPDRPSISSLAGLDDFEPVNEELDKLVSYGTSALLESSGGSFPFPEYRPSLTTQSLSILTNPVDGGLKGDLSTLFANGLDSSTQGQGIYQANELNVGYMGPTFDLLKGYNDLYQSLGQTTEFASSVEEDGFGATAPSDYSAFRGSGDRIRLSLDEDDAPTDPILFPNIVRVDVVFSITARNAHGPHIEPFRAKRMDYMIHLLYQPIITVHNPYNVPMSFEGMKVNFQDLPVGFQLVFDGADLTTEPIPLNQLYIENNDSQKGFGMTLVPGSPSQEIEPVTLEPGQTKIFGTPYIPRGHSWARDRTGGNAGSYIFDWEQQNNDLTADFFLNPSTALTSNAGNGFDIDNLLPHSWTAKGEQHRSGQVVGCRPDTQIGVRFAPKPPRARADAFTVTIEMDTGRGQLRSVGAINVNYGDIDNLEEILEQGSSDGSANTEEREYPLTWPDPNGGGNYIARELWEADTQPIRNYENPKPFAVFRLSGQTTRGSLLPNRTYVDNSPFQNVAEIDLSQGIEAAGDAPFEMSLVRPAPDLLQENRENEEAYFFVDHGSNLGSRRATFYEFPKLPVQSLAQFRHARLSNTGFPPYATYTVGESWGHPIMGADEVTGSSVDGASIYDHTYLSNAAMWDSYFLSTLADGYPSRSSDAQENREAVFGGDRDSLNPRIAPLDGIVETGDAIDALEDPDGWRKAARYLGLRGGFNVNSTSKEAWVSILSSLKGATVSTYSSDEEELADDMTAFPRERRPSSTAIAGGGGFGTASAEPRWQGFRELSSAQIDSLAQEIVEQVRLRGPFLSLSEFVNRRLEGGYLGYQGAIESAIEGGQNGDSDINALMNNDSRELESGDGQYHNWENPGAVVGKPSTQGAPGSLSQGDVLSAIGSYLTVRGDTFLIRCYGESRDSAGNVEAQAWCEATVQRTPEYVDSSDEPDQIDNLSSTNESFGRKFVVTSFRWLSPEEV